MSKLWRWRYVVSTSIVPLVNFAELIRTFTPVWCSRPRPTAGVHPAPSTMNFVGHVLTTSDRIFHWSPEVHEFGKRSFPICPKCNISQFSPQHILQCQGFPVRRLLHPPAVLRLCTDLWTHGSGLVSLDQMGISPTTTT
ncbi:uncharacterized protein TNCV_2788941 [Trichonephila clavipes]|uniref:Uncharacterized protein n=1 Tax=Trichonephila clavipes TaxID=2585209 RepID=A0A8X6VWG7_TRICX|nr:uncharacterized protein TNCV_2788941 [Trichonephila clavipes]